MIALSIVHVSEAHADAPPYGGISWYAETGYDTCSGEYYTGEDFTAALKYAYDAPGERALYEIGDYLAVSWAGRTAYVRVTDCSPYPDTGDLSQAAAEYLGYAWTYGRVWPEIEVLAYGDGYDPWSGWCRYYGC